MTSRAELKKRLERIEKATLPTKEAPLLGPPFTPEQERYWRLAGISYGRFEIVNGADIINAQED